MVSLYGLISTKWMVIILYRNGKTQYFCRCVLMTATLFVCIEQREPRHLVGQQDAKGEPSRPVASRHARALVDHPHEALRHACRPDGPNGGRQHAQPLVRVVAERVHSRVLARTRPGLVRLLVARLRCTFSSRPVLDCRCLLSPPTISSSWLDVRSPTREEVLAKKYLDKISRAMVFSFELKKIVCSSTACFSAFLRRCS